MSDQEFMRNLFHQHLKPLDRRILDLETADDTQSHAHTVTVPLPLLLSSYMDINSRFTDQNIHGALTTNALAQPLSIGVPVNFTKGIGKIIVMVTAGADITGSITVTGTSVDRNTKVETPGDTEVLTISTLSVDNSIVDGGGNPVHRLDDGYITSKWFKGAIALSTTDVNCTVDVWHCSFEQFNDQPDITVNTFDINALVTNANAFIYAYLYTVMVTSGRVDAVDVASLVLTAADAVANEYYRLRQGNIAAAIDGTTDGVFIEVFLGRITNPDIEQMTTKVWATRDVVLAVT